MAGNHVVSPEICHSIVRWARRVDLPALCLTSKSFYQPASAKLYTSISLSDARVAWRTCQNLAVNSRLPPLVRHLFLYQQNRQAAAMPRAFWLAVQAALNSMLNLETLTLGDPFGKNTWVLDPAQIRFQLREVRLWFYWDAHIVAFLEGQTRLRSLQAMDCNEEDERSSVSDGALRTLQVFDGPLHVASELVRAAVPLTHLQVTLDNESAPQLDDFIRILGKYRDSAVIKSLNVHDIPDDDGAAVLNIIAKTCPKLRHLGLLPLPWNNRHKIHHSLLLFTSLNSLEFSVAHWSPQPHMHLQRSLAAELRIYCPSLRTVTFWIGGVRFTWGLVDEGSEKEGLTSDGTDLSFSRKWRVEPLSNCDPVASLAWKIA